ncbi:MAG TPA: VCBS repeat-containing protein [Pirellulales bacterium]|jgi:hypothetical protein|nr:VCBS repeat-containing protein [Pirellulales bacterium]
MFRPQFSVAGLLGAVTFVAVACAALAKPSEWWASILITATVVALVTAGLSAWFRRGPRRFFARGFAIVGAAYLWLVFGHGFGATIATQLLTTKALVYAESKWHRSAVNDLMAFQYVNANTVYLDVTSGTLAPQGGAVGDFDLDGNLDLFVVNPPALYANNGNGTFRALSTNSSTPSSTFHVIGQLLWTWILAAAGGWLAAHWRARRQSEA